VTKRIGQVSVNQRYTEAKTAELPPRDISGLKWALVVLSILSSTFLFVLDNTVVADVQPAVVTHFNSFGKLTWLSVAFLVGAAAMNSVWGKIYLQLALILHGASLVEVK
jgi:hypothetical protein